MTTLKNKQSAIAMAYGNHGISADQLSNNLRPFPSTASRLLSLCNSADAPIHEVTELIECEPAIGIKLLAMANSPLFGTSREVASVSHAIVLLGYEAVIQLALSIAAGPLFLSGNEEHLGFRIQLMRESLACSTVCRLLAGIAYQASPSEAFFGGMMLDIGKLLLLDISPTAYVEILEQEPPSNMNTIESEVFGADHAELGGSCALQWGLPNSVIQAIKQHHQKPQENFVCLSRVAIAGNYFARKWCIGFPEADVLPKTDHSFENSLSSSSLHEIQVQAIDAYKEVAMLLLPEGCD